jgi:hypothetical protein
MSRPQPHGSIQSAVFTCAFRTQVIEIILSERQHIARSSVVCMNIDQVDLTMVKGAAAVLSLNRLSALLSYKLRAQSDINDAEHEQASQ